jgi:hypothetical protein
MVAETVAPFVSAVCACAVEPSAVAAKAAKAKAVILFDNFMIALLLNKLFWFLFAKRFANCIWLRILRRTVLQTGAMFPQYAATGAASVVTRAKKPRRLTLS